MKRNFEEWLKSFRNNITNYDYYVDFEKVFNNIDNIKIELNILNSLIGSKNIEQEFKNILVKYPTVINCIPILLAIRKQSIQVLNENKEINCNFKENKITIDECSYFMRKIGLFDLLKNNKITNLVDYVTGIEVGLDSNARKNRTGHLMENLVEDFIKKAEFIKDVNYFKEMYISEITEKYGIDLSAISNSGKTEKRFDFVIKTENMIYVIETNFYSSNGSKLNETARSYKNIAKEIKNIKGIKFIWFTDGKGWNNARHNLEETFEIMEDIYNINDLENNIINKVII